MDKPEPSEEYALEVAYRTAYVLTRQGLFSTSQLPKKRNPEGMTAIQLKAEVEALNDEIKTLRDAAEGRLKPSFNVIEEHIGLPEKVRERNRCENMELIKKGIEVLERWRSAYTKRLRLIKLKQPLIGRLLSEAEALNAQAKQVLAEIEWHRAKVKEAVERFRQLQRRFSEIQQQYDNLNVNPERKVQFKHEVPRRALDFTT